MTTNQSETVEILTSQESSIETIMEFVDYTEEVKNDDYIDVCNFYNKTHVNY